MSSIEDTNLQEKEDNSSQPDSPAQEPPTPDPKTPISNPVVRSASNHNNNQTEAWCLSPTHTPLFYWPIADAPLATKLTHLRAALAAGHDPNATDRSPNPKRRPGRPAGRSTSAWTWARSAGWATPRRGCTTMCPSLRCCWTRGADPRLEGVPERPHVPGYPKRPVDDARLSVEYLREQWRVRQREEKEGSDACLLERRELEFYEEAYRLMKEAADRLDGKAKATICFIQ